MAQHRTQGFCDTCGALIVWGGKHVKQRLRCYECGVKAMEQGMDSLVAREGPVYDRWLAGMARALERAQAHKLAQSGGEPGVPDE